MKLLSVFSSMPKLISIIHWIKSWDVMQCPSPHLPKGQYCLSSWKTTVKETKLHKEKASYQTTNNCSCMKKLALKLYHTCMRTWWNRQLQNTGYSSQVTVFNTNTESILTFIKANLRPKNFCLGLIRPEVRIYKCLEYLLCW